MKNLKMPTPSPSNTSGIGGFNLELNELRGQSLEVHLPPQSSGDLIGGRGVVYNSLSTVDDFSDDIEFHVPPDPECCFVLNQSRLEGCFVVKDESGANVAATDKVVLAPHYSACLFSQIQIYLNGTQVCDQSSGVSYPFKHHIDTMLSYHVNTMEYALQAEGCLPNHYGACGFLFDPVTGFNDNSTCVCFKNAREKILNGKKVYFSSTIGADILRMDKYLPPNIDIKIKLKRFNRKFGIAQNEAAKTFSISLQDVKLRMRKVLPALEIRNRSNVRLNSRPGFISYEDSHLKQFHIPVGSTNYSANYINTDMGLMPNQAIFAIIDSAVLSKEKSKMYPFRFVPAKLSSVMIKKNARPILPLAMECNFDEGNYIQLYEHFMSNLSAKISITAKSFALDKFFLCFDLTPDKCHSFHNHLSEPGNLEIDLTFSTATTKSYTLISYCFYNASLRIDNNGQVSKSYF